jgi:hypothetical protein
MAVRVRMAVIVVKDVAVKLILAVRVLVRMVMIMHGYFLRFFHPWRGDMRLFSKLYIFVIQLHGFWNFLSCFNYKTDYFSVNDY